MSWQPPTHAWIAALAIVAMSCASTPMSEATPTSPAQKIAWGLVVHGGAGTIARDKLTPEREAAMRAALAQALRAGHDVIGAGGSSVDAVQAAIVILEDSPYFNAGKGAVFTHDGVNELDAAIMSGPTRRAGAIAGVRTVKNPILLARAVMDKSRHVLLVGAGADEFAKVAGVEVVEPSYFRTEERWQQLQDALRDDKFGTVGAVALDKSGALAAGTSTGGITNKRYGRVGDSPLIGSGTYANRWCAVSATGHGELFIRYTVARDICARVEYAGLSLTRAAADVVLDQLVRIEGRGGVIALDHAGHVTMPFNTAGMYRGYIGADGVPDIDIYQTAP